MPAPDRTEILRRAKEAFREHGRGFVVVVEDREEPHYGLLDELRENPAEEPEADTLIEATEFALRAYVPEAEAVVIDSRPEGIFVVIISSFATWPVGEILWGKTT